MSGVKLKYRPNPTEGIHFTGGEQNAKEVMAWLKERGYYSRWVGTTPTLGFDENSREALARFGTERIEFSREPLTTSYRDKVLRLNQWVVFMIDVYDDERRSYPQMLTSEDIIRTFKIVED